MSEFSGPQDERHAWKAVELIRARKSWMRRVTALHFGYAAVSIGTSSNPSSFNTVEEVAHLDPVSRVEGERRYSFNVTRRGEGNLFQRCFTRHSRHSFITGSRVGGPNVWLDCVAVDTHSDDGPHHRWAGAQVMLWNSQAGTIRSDAPAAVMRWVVGSEGEREEGRFAPQEPFGIWQAHGRRVLPRSL